MKKSEKTKIRLYEVAMEMFAEKGFDATTMRGIAKKAGVASGATYYYFESKESFIYEYYKHSHADHMEAMGDFLQKEKSFSKRLHKVLTSKIEVADPYKDMARALFRVSAHPHSPMSPFSEPSKQLRVAAIDIFKQVIEGSDQKFHSSVIEMLPEYLWLFQMGTILFWIHDSSMDSKKTYELIDKTVPLLNSTNQLINSKVAGPFRKKVIHILENFKPDFGRESEITKE